MTTVFSWQGHNKEHTMYLHLYTAPAPTSRQASVKHKGNYSYQVLYFLYLEQKSSGEFWDYKNRSTADFVLQN